MDRDRRRPGLYLLLVLLAAALVWWLSPEEPSRSIERVPRPASRPSPPADARLVAPETRPSEPGPR
ncbi:MAG: hypothetical protein L0323_18195 [Planctomycetes bacterium]|nr:hypothetical protein [Planctomycetota bacterium]